MDSSDSDASSSMAEVRRQANLRGVVVSDAAGKILSVNDHVCRLFGRNRKELVGHSIKVLMENVYAQQHDNYMKRYSDTAQPKVIGTTRIVSGVRSNGEKMQLRLALSMVPGESTSLVGVPDEVCSRKSRAEGTLFCALLERVTEHSVTVVVDDKGIISKVSGNPKATFGYDTASLVGQNINLLCTSPITSDDDDMVHNVEGRHRNGHIIPVALEVTKLTSHPVTFQARLTEVEETTEAVVTVDSRGIIRSASDTCRVLFGYEQLEMEGRKVSLIARDVKLQTGHGVLSAQHKDGSHFFISADVTEYEEGGRTMYRGILHRVVKSKRDRRGSDGTFSDLIEQGDMVGWYEITRSLGSGFFGTVKLARHRLTGLSVAVKSLRKAQYLENNMMYPPREIDLIRRLNHPNICRLYDTIVTEDVIFMITEAVPGGELFDYVAQKEHLEEPDARFVFRQLLDATDYMHRSGIVHRDLKMENILMDGHGGVKIIDLGLGNFFSSGALLNTFCGSADYAAPELWRGKPYTGPGVDVWSLGVVLFIMTTGFIPFNDSQAVLAISYHWPKRRQFSSELKHLVARIFCDHKERISVPEMMVHPWVTENGELPAPTPRSPKGERIECNELVLEQMAELGFPEEDTRQAVLEDHHNQITTTYWLLVHQTEIAQLSPPRYRSDTMNHDDDAEEGESRKNSSTAKSGEDDASSGSGSRRGSIRDHDENHHHDKCAIM